MAVEPVRCLHCQTEEVVKYGTTANGKTRFRCQPKAGCGRTFIRAYAYRGRVPLVKRQIVELTLNGNGCGILPASCRSVRRRSARN